MREQNRGDRLLRWTATGFAWLILVLIGAFLLQLIVSAAPTIREFGLGFLTSTAWSATADEFGALPFIFGTLVTSLLALLIATPIGLGVAIFLSELSPRWIRTPVSFLVELLAAIPSIVYGIWGLFVLVPIVRAFEIWTLGSWVGRIPLFQGAPFGIGILAAGLILTIMILPTIAAVARDVFLAVPADQREASLALGATRWETTSRAVLTYARSGVIGAIVLALGRALGETMAVTMVIGNAPSLTASLFSPGATMASVIANEFAEATGDLHLAALVELGLVLFGVTVILNSIARLLVSGVGGGVRSAERG